jgi:hypothetical protein
MVRPDKVGMVAVMLIAMAPTVAMAQTLGYALGGPIICGKTCALWYVGGGGEKLRQFLASALLGSMEVVSRLPGR